MSSCTELCLGMTGKMREFGSLMQSVCSLSNQTDPRRSVDQDFFRGTLLTGPFQGLSKADADSIGVKVGQNFVAVQTLGFTAYGLLPIAGFRHGVKGLVFVSKIPSNTGL